MLKITHISKSFYLGLEVTISKSLFNSILDIYKQYVVRMLGRRAVIGLLGPSVS